MALPTLAQTIEDYPRAGGAKRRARELIPHGDIDIANGIHRHSKCDIANGEIFSQDIAKKFDVFRRDREHTKGGGVFIAVSSDLVCSREYKLETDCEIRG